MASCYGDIDTKRSHTNLEDFPFTVSLKDGTQVTVNRFPDALIPQGHALFNLIIREGRTWPFETELSVQQFVQYFLSHNAFAVYSETHLIGMFYIKPNFPGRCGHICNGGFIADPLWRGKGIGRLMGKLFVRVAPQLGYKSAMFNLVFASNDISIRLWESLGFKRIGTIPSAAQLSGMSGLVDAHQYFLEFDA